MASACLLAALNKTKNKHLNMGTPENERNACSAELRPPRAGQGAFASGEREVARWFWFRDRRQHGARRVRVRTQPKLVS